MSKGIRISLQPGEKIFVNGAVIRVDRKVSVELLNDVTFLLETHVMQAEHANTPLKQLYFVLQTILMDPAKSQPILVLYKQMLGSLIGSFQNREILSELKFIDGLVAAERCFEALKSLRALFPREAGILGGAGFTAPAAAPEGELALCK